MGREGGGGTVAGFSRIRCGILPHRFFCVWGDTRGSADDARTPGRRKIDDPTFLEGRSGTRGQEMQYRTRARSYMRKFGQEMHF